jgi:hypothetical protein
MHLSPDARRRWAIGIVAFFLLMCGSIAVAQWWAIHKNVPDCQRQIAAGRHC